jgi:DNA-binding response OmpR family regulator
MATTPVILCVDDDEAVLLTLKLLLEASGFQVLTATSGNEALAIFNSQAVDLVLLDYAMPGLSGIAIATRMKRSKAEVPIAFLSAYRELPGETIGVAEWWIRKGEEDPERLVARLTALASRHTGRRGESPQRAS